MSRQTERWPYREGECALCGDLVGGRGVLCDVCHAGRERGTSRYQDEPLHSRLERLLHWERTGKPSWRPRWR